ncbi:MAG: hypothetical protein C4297_13980 [Gemmataceae bacterium]
MITLWLRKLWFQWHVEPTSTGQDKARGSIRWELVRRVRREIAAGTYDTPDKLRTALERLLERLRDENE